MTKREKRKNKFLISPSNVSYKEMESFLLGLEFDKRQKGTSHAVFYNGNCIIRLTVPHKTGGTSLLLRKNTVLEIMNLLMAAGIIEE